MLGRRAGSPRANSSASPRRPISSCRTTARSRRAPRRGPGTIGTTGRGIGFAYRDKIARTGLRVADLYDRAGFVERADRTLHRLRLEFGGRAGARADERRRAVRIARPLADWLRPMVCDVSAELFDAWKQGRRLLLEARRARCSTWTTARTVRDVVERERRGAMVMRRAQAVGRRR